MSRVKSCPNCGTPFETMNIQGETFPWKDFPFVVIADSFNVAGCKICGEMVINAEAVTQLDNILESSIRSECAKFIEEIKSNAKFKQKELAKAIGMTAVYLSELIGKKRTPSYQIFNLLKILANCPKTIKQLKCFEGNCNMAAEDVAITILKEKFSHTAESEIRQLAGGSIFITMNNNVRETIH